MTPKLVQNLDEMPDGSVILAPDHEDPDSAGGLNAIHPDGSIWWKWERYFPGKGWEKSIRTTASEGYALTDYLDNGWEIVT